MSAQPQTPRDHFAYVRVDDPLAAPLLEELAREYQTRYADLPPPPQEIGNELLRFPASAFAPPDGAFLLLLRDGQAVAGGAFMRHAEPATAEFKRIWTRHDSRRQGLARRVLAELEAQAVRQGYTRVRLGTGSRQPEAVALYQASGYTLLGRRDYLPGHPPGYSFEKPLPVP